jgi:hypothetical protein
MILARDISTQMKEILGEGILLAPGAPDLLEPTAQGTVQNVDFKQVDINANLRTRPERPKLEILIIRAVALKFETAISSLRGKTPPLLASARLELQTLKILYTGLIGDLVPGTPNPESIIDHQNKRLRSCVFLASEPGVENIWDDAKVISRVENFLWISHQEQKLQVIAEIGQCLDRIQDIVYELAKNEAKYVRVTSEAVYS